MRPELAMEFDSTKWNRCVLSGLPTDSPLFCIGTVKNSLGLHEFDQKMSMYCVHEIVEVNDLSCVEFGRLMQELNVLT